MRTRYDCLLDGVSLTQVDESLYVTDILEETPRMKWKTVRPARGGGMLLTDAHREALQVTVRFAIRENRVERRAQVMEAVQTWCHGTRLQLNTRPGRVLLGRCTELPRIGSALRWTGELSMTFTAWRVPYWQSEQASRVTLKGSGEAAGTLFVPGNAEEAPVSVLVKNTSSAACGSMTLRCGDTLMTFAGLGLAAGETLRAAYDEEDVLSLSIVGTNGAVRSAMGFRTGDSADGLYLACGKRGAVSVQMSGSFEAVFSARGRWV